MSNFGWNSRGSRFSGHGDRYGEDFSMRNEFGGNSSTNFRCGNLRETYSSDVRNRLGPVHSVNEQFKRGKRGRGRGRHPRGLIGKEIGLWYARQSAGNREDVRKEQVPKLSMDQYEVNAIHSAIDDLTGNATYVARAGPSGNDNVAYDDDDDDKISDQMMEVVDEDVEQYVDEVKQELFDYFDNPLLVGEEEDTQTEEQSTMEQDFNSSQNNDFKNGYRANLEGNKRRDQGLSGLLEKSKLVSLKRSSELDLNLIEELKAKSQDKKYIEMQNVRMKLPSYSKREKILKLIYENQVVVLSGETGCGKTTQVSQFILDSEIQNGNGSLCRIVCTQPRRISAISVAERVAEERAEKLKNSVGYQIRLEARLPRPQGSILFVTTGIVLQWLQSDPFLSQVSHLILDEIHERDSLSDFLICISKDLLPLRPDLKIILMSATLNAEQFSVYFNNCPMIHIPGFTFSVQEYYLEDVLKLTSFQFPNQNRKYKFRQNEEKAATEFEDYIVPYVRGLEKFGNYPPSVTYELYKMNSEQLNLDLILSLLMHIVDQPPGAVLVFLPGWEQISKLNKMIKEEPIFNPRFFVVIPLHSMMPTVNQKVVFEKPPPGVRKIVIATNIAETSITINDVVYVINGGYIKMKKYDRESNVSTLQPEWVSLANAKQRKGRAGRVREGVCYHLYTKAREMRLDEYCLPEIKRTRLEEVVLQVKILQLGSSKTFLRKILEPPEEEIVDTTIKMLETINALDVNENLTPLGFHLARLPMDPLTGKMILMGSIFSCLGPALTVAAALSYKDPFIMFPGEEKVLDRTRQLHARGMNSDHLMLVNVFKSWQENGGERAREFMRSNFLSFSIISQLKRMRVQFMQHLKANKFVKTDNPDAKEVNLNSNNLEVVKAVLTAGLYPNVAQIIKVTKGNKQGLLSHISIDGTKVKFHPKSVNARERLFQGNWIVYWEKLKSSKVFLYDATEISNYPLLLFGKKLKYNPTERRICVDDFVKVECEKDVADVIKKLRKELNDLLEYKITHPGPTNWDGDTKESKLLKLIIEVLSNEKVTMDPKAHYKRYFK